MNNELSKNHFIEYELHKIYAIEILQAEWDLTINQWAEFFIQNEMLRDYAPVTSGYWLNRIDMSQPFALGNIKVAPKQEPAPRNPSLKTYRYKTNKRKYEGWFNGV